MDQYRLHYIDVTNNIRDIRVLNGRDDAHAIALAEEARDGRRMELWQRDRLVQRWEPARRGS